MGNINNGVTYWFLDEDDYDDLSDLITGGNLPSGFDFGTVIHITSGDYKGYYFEFGEIDNDEMEWLAQFESFDMRTVNMSNQAGVIV